MANIDHVVLHGGMHKTGSTSIQEAFDGYVDSSVRYARLSIPNHSIPIRAAYSFLPWRIPQYRRIGKTAIACLRAKYQFRRIITDELKKPTERLIFSAEELGSMPRHAVASFVRSLLRYAGTVTAIMYVRDPKSFASSVFQQQVRSGRGVFSIPQPNYRRRLGTLGGVLGRDAVQFVCFDPNSFPGRSVVNDFCQRVGVAPEALRAPLTRSNKSLSLESTALLYCWNRADFGQTITAKGVSAIREMLGELEKTFHSPFRLADSVVDSGLNWDDVRWMEAYTGIAHESIMELAPESRQYSISSEADLIEIGRNSMGGLREVMESLGVASSITDRPEEALQRLYEGLVARAERSRGPADPP
jgi:hypothetical protein